MMLTAPKNPIIVQLLEQFEPVANGLTLQNYTQISVRKLRFAGGEKRTNSFYETESNDDNRQRARGWE